MEVEARKGHPMVIAYTFARTGFVALPKLSCIHTLGSEVPAHLARRRSGCFLQINGDSQAQRFQNFLSRRVGIASVGWPSQSVNGPIERAGVMHFVGRERANQACGNPGQGYGRSIRAHLLG